MSYLYILESNSLLVVLFAILSHSEGFLFTLLIVSFIVQKLLGLIRFHLLIFVFISINLGHGHRASCCDLAWRELCLFSSKSFIFSGLTFRSLIHLGFIFVYGVRKCSSFILLFVVDQFSQYQFMKILYFLHCIL